VAINSPITFASYAKEKVMDIASVKIQLRDSGAPFGAVLSASLTVRGPSLKGFCKFDDAGYGVFTLYEHTDAFLRSSWYPDSLGVGSDWAIESNGEAQPTFDHLEYEALMLQLGIMDQHNYHSHRRIGLFLVLIRKKQPAEVWERIGLLDLVYAADLRLEDSGVITMI
jgi:hypothetical protein